MTEKHDQMQGVRARTSPGAAGGAMPKAKQAHAPRGKNSIVQSPLAGTLSALRCAAQHPRLLALLRKGLPASRARWPRLRSASLQHSNAAGHHTTTEHLLQHLPIQMQHYQVPAHESLLCHSARAHYSTAPGLSHYMKRPFPGHSPKSSFLRILVAW